MQLVQTLWVNAVFKKNSPGYIIRIQQNEINVTTWKEKPKHNTEAVVVAATYTSLSQLSLK